MRISKWWIRTSDQLLKMSLSLPTTLSDSELRGRVLRWFYDRRREGTINVGDFNFSDTDTATEFYRIANQLRDHELIALKNISVVGSRVDPMNFPKYSGSISADGVDVVEGNSIPPISITIDNRNMNVNVSNSQGVQVGNSHSQMSVHMSVEQLRTKLSEAPASEKREEAKKLWNRLVEHPLVCALLGGAVSTLKIN